MRVEVLVDVKTELGEGPVWDVREERLYWIDGTGRRVYRATAEGREVRAWDLPEQVGSLALREGGGAVVALRNGLHLLDFDTGETALVFDPEPDRPETLLNDGKADRAGRFVFGSLDTTPGGRGGALYRMDRDHRVRRLDAGFNCSNGPCWSPDGRTFYFADSGAGEIWAYDYDPVTGDLGGRRSFARPASGVGVPDGATVDAEGFVWNAQVFDGLVVRYAPDGRIDRTLSMPVRNVTSVMFGGPDLDILFVTSMAKRHLPTFPQDGILRGSVFAVHGLGVRGLPEPRFAG